MLNPSNPSAGVYGKIIDLSERIPNVSSSVAAFVGEAEMGEVGVPVLVTDTGDRQAKFGTLNPQRYGFAGYSLNQFLKVANRAYFLRVVNGAKTALSYLTVDDTAAQNPVIRLVNNTVQGTNTPQGVDDPLNTVGFLPTQPGVANIMGYFCAANPGKWNNNITISVSPSNPQGVALRGNGHNPRHFVVSVWYGALIAGVGAAERFVVSRNYEVDENGSQMYIEDVINSRSRYIRYKNNELCPVFDIVTGASETMNGGLDGDRVTDAQIIQAWDKFNDPERVEVSLLVNSGYTNHNIHHKMLQVAEQRGDAYAILDMPSDKQQVADAITYRRQTLNANTFYGGIYAPDVLIYDEFTDRKIYVPISGYIAAVMAYTDSTKFLWFAPAGINVGILNVLGLRQSYDQGARDALSEAQVNHVRKLPRGLGFCVWSQYTLYNRASSFQDCNVVRLSLHILKASKRFTINKLFDPQDRFLRAQVKTAADDFMTPIQNNRGVYEFSNICDERNNTPDIIANNDLVLDMIYDPVIATKRIHVRFNLNPKGSRMTDVTAA